MLNLHGKQSPTTTPPATRNLVRLTSDYYGGGFLGRVAYIVVSHAAVDPRVLRGDCGQGEGAPIQDALLWQHFHIPHPREGGCGLPVRRDAYQSHHLARVYHHRVVSQQLDGR